MVKKELQKTVKIDGRRVKVYKFQLNPKKIVVWLLVLFVFLPWLGQVLNNQVEERSLSVTRAMWDISAGYVESVEVMGDNLLLKYRGGEVRFATKETGQSFGELLEQYQIDPASIDYEVYNSSLWEKLGGVVNVVFMLVMVVMLIMMIRQVRGGGGVGGGGMFGLGRSKAKLFAKGKQDTKFADVAGVDEAKKELEEVVDFLKHPQKYKKVGARTPKGVLLVGPAGVGKTLMARAVAGEADVSFFSMAGSEFMEMLVGVGASRVRDLFATAKKASPSIIFIDEIDAIGRARTGSGGVGGHDEREQTLNQILVEMDGFTVSDNVVVLAATNRPDVLDEALIRPGRFDRRVTLDLPDIEGRKAILAIHAKGKPFAKGLEKGGKDWEVVARRTVGFSGADLENMLNEAAIGVARDNRNKITLADIEEAATKVKMGPEKKRMQLKEEREMTAYHEAGHAIVTHFLAHTDPVHRISIVARGSALGYTMIPPATDKYQKTRTELVEEVCTLLGGRGAEELIYSELTAGASSDIDRATKIVRAMVVKYGMSKLGPIDFEVEVGVRGWSKGFNGGGEISEAKKAEIDAEVYRIIKVCESLTAKILKDQRQVMDKVVEALMEKESLERDEFEALMPMTKDEVKKVKKYIVKL